MTQHLSPEEKVAIEKEKKLQEKKDKKETKEAHRALDDLIKRAKERDAFIEEKENVYESH